MWYVDLLHLYDFPAFSGGKVCKKKDFTNIDIFHKKNPLCLKEDMSLIHTVYGFFIQTAKNCWIYADLIKKLEEKFL